MQHLHHAAVRFLLSWLWLRLTAAQSFDYIIAGGGTAGLAIAARLTENPAITVAVVEAGADHSNDTNILAPGLAVTTYGNPEYDWGYSTVPQAYANGRVIFHPRGKQLGGSSAINSLYWVYASQRDINNWGALGNANWSWDMLNPYYTKSENFVAPTPQQAEAFATGYLDPSFHGRSGPVVNAFPNSYDTFSTAWPSTFANLGLAWDGDPREGLALGGGSNLLSLSPINNARSYAANTYYADAKGRPNLTVFTGALAEKVIFSNNLSDGGNLRAIGLQFSHNNSSRTITAKREVILCGGVFNTPQLLELSGIGNPEILQPLNIDVRVDNPNVGENLQDHLYVPYAYQVNSSLPTGPDLSNPQAAKAAIAEYMTNHTGPFAASFDSNSFLSYSQIINITRQKSAAQWKHRRPIFPDSSDLRQNRGLAEQYEIIFRDLFGSEAIAQLIQFPIGISPQYPDNPALLFTTPFNATFWTSFGVLMHPFSRGSVHINSSDPTDYPVIDPNYLSNPLDVYLLATMLLMNQHVAATPPLTNLLQHESDGSLVLQPGYPAVSTIQEAEAWVRKSCLSISHPAGTCPMLPREKGGVVNNKFIVYGTSNLRVVDASVFPLQPRGNLQTLVYAIAERASDWIKEAYAAS